ncbi:protein-tyrosine phosphatase-like protein [Aspergillus cavernicola]|uniref:Protein-tyrosine phosphatase-like protein n=1 Tax=Aspergillus cavernicola TaxID=176166 RepID=A0ABR4ILM3_9EURO
MSSNTDTPESGLDRPFDNIINFRDVGRTINNIAGKKLVKEGVLFRSARLDEASEEDIRRLTGDLHISTIIDLRSTTEHHMAITKHKKKHPTPFSSAKPESSSEITEEGRAAEEDEYIHLPSLENTNTTRHLISLTGRAFEKQLLWRLDWWNFTKVLAYLASGYRKDAVRIIGENVMKPIGLTGLAMDTLEASTAEMKEIFGILSSYPAPSPNVAVVRTTDLGLDSSSGSGSGSRSAVLIHCTQGKDRTGLIVLLSLLLTGAVAGETIAREYVLSEKELEDEPVEEKEARLREIRALGLDEEYARCPVDFTEMITGFLGEKYGGVQGYLEFIGVEKRVVEKVRGRFLA